MLFSIKTIFPKSDESVFIITIYMTFSKKVYINKKPKEKISKYFTILLGQLQY